MSNPSIKVLSSCTINNTFCCVEDNLGESIHVHMGGMRLEMTIKDFLSFARSIESASNELLSLYGIDHTKFDEFAMDWAWLGKCSRAKSASIKMIKVGDLWSNKLILNKFGCEGVVVTSKIRNISLHSMSNLKDSKSYGQIRYNNQTDQERFDYIRNIISERGYPFNGAYIIVNQFNQIYDGDHRAMVLKELYGPDKEIQVYQINFEGEQPIKKQRRRQFRQIKRFVLKTFLPAFFRKTIRYQMLPPPPKNTRTSNHCFLFAAC